MPHPSPWLEAYRIPKGVSGNPAGGPKRKPLSDAMKMLLDGDKEGFMALPKPLRLQVARWYGDALTCPKSRALLLSYVDGAAPKAVEDKPLPVTEFVLQVIGQQPSLSEPSKNGHVTEVEAEPVSDGE